MRYSIIIPAYNVGPYIVDTLGAAYMAADETTEIIVINDGSTDNTAELIKGVIEDSECSERFIFINQENQGVSAARNAGINEASGDYLIFCDGDDRCESGLITALNKYYDDKPDMILGGFSSLEYDSGHIEIKQGRFTDDVVDGPSAFKSILFGRNKIRLGSFAVSKAMTDKYGIDYTVGCPLSQDVEYIYKCLARAKTVCCTEEMLVTYVKRSGSVMFRYNLKRFEAPRTMKRIYEYVRDNTKLCEDAEINEYLGNGFILLHAMYSFEALLPYCNSHKNRKRLWSDYIEQYGDVEEEISRINRVIKKLPFGYSNKRIKLFLLNRCLYMVVMWNRRNYRVSS